MKMAEGIILKKTPRREADAVFEVYTKELGLARFQAKGVRKQAGKLKTGLELFNHAEIYFVPAKREPIITDVKVKDNFSNIRRNLFRLKLAGAVAFVLGRILEPGLAEEDLWRKVLEYFQNLNNGNLERPELVNNAYVFAYQLLILNGLKPQLMTCAKCHKNLFKKNSSISLSSAGLIHYDCLTLYKHSFRFANVTLNLSENIVYLASEASNIKKETVSIASVKSDGWEDFARMVRILFEYHFGIDLKALL